MKNDVKQKEIWLVNPYGPIEGENWREYSFNQFGKFLSKEGFRVVWWTSNFSHHFKKYRSNGWKDIEVSKDFVIRLVPTSSYKKNFGFGRIRKDRIFAKNFLKYTKTIYKPNLIISADNPLTKGRPSYIYAKSNNVPIIYDQMDIWPEFIIQYSKPYLRWILKIAFSSVIKKRKKIYDNLDGCIALGKNYLDFMFTISPTLKDKPHALVYNGIDVDSFRTHLKQKSLLNLLPKKQNNKIWCIFAGTLGPSYDIQNLLECAKRFNSDKESPFIFVVAGSGPFEEEIKNTSKLLDNLFYIGKLLPQDLIPIYGLCDIGLCTYSRGSNVDMCDKFYDYTAAGLAIINSLTGEVAHHIAKNKIGINYNAEDCDSLYDALSYFKNRVVLDQSKKSSYDLGTQFDAKEQNAKLLGVIRKII